MGHTVDQSLRFGSLGESRLGKKWKSALWGLLGTGGAGRRACWPLGGLQSSCVCAEAPTALAQSQDLLHPLSPPFLPGLLPRR